MKICRPHVSPYFLDDFLSKEKKTLESISKNLSYTNVFDSSVDILITDTHFKIEDYDLRNIKLVLHANSGFDNLLPLKNSLPSFPVVLGNEIRAHAVCQYILTALYAHMGSIPKCAHWDGTRAYQRKSLKHSKVQLLGFGQIGNLVHQSLNGLCAEIYIYDPLKKYLELKIEEADVLICAASLSQKSQSLINRAMIAKFKPTLLLINPSRGKVIDQKALIDFLKLHPQSFAYLDVFEAEPTDFLAFPKNTHLSSHIAGVYDQLGDDTIEFEQRILCDFLSLNSADFSLKYQQVLIANNPEYLDE